jgi:hypothetical protein
VNAFVQVFWTHRDISWTNRICKRYMSYNYSCVCVKGEGYLRSTMLLMRIKYVTARDKWPAENRDDQEGNECDKRSKKNRVSNKLTNQ